MMSHTSPTRLQRGAFTLIELLVVISVIALLVGLLIPTLAKNREATRRLKCQINMRSLGQGLQMYMDTESRGQMLLPKVRPINEGGNDNDPSLLDIMAKYISAPVPFRPSENADWVVTEPFRCPSDVGGVKLDEPRPTWAQIGWSYRYIAGEVIFAAEAITVRNPQFGVSRAYEKSGNLSYIMVDFDSWHHPRWKSIANDNDMSEEQKWDRNGLFYGDWHVGKAAYVPNDRASAFISDVVQFGGGLGG
jgi:prepilin-type N-terminal cleavage/methylation domain-containing protein